DLLLRHDWQTVLLEDILAAELSPFDDKATGRIRLNGPEVELRPDLALSVGMVIHEMATNAAKYGALAQSSGRLQVRWSVREAHGGKNLVLIWREMGGPPVSEPRHRGFGTKLIERMIGNSDGAGFAFDFKPTGLEFSLTLPI
ncbi:HWE histidine kinase domain-containing protein, partial [Escherichia coli]|uniref:HWE histidine kinase domain-containing protein n=1 Tax=Escherichia coli TaxID=562 RepID=UPI0025A208B5